MQSVSSSQADQRGRGNAFAVPQGKKQTEVRALHFSTLSHQEGAWTTDTLSRSPQTMSMVLVHLHPKISLIRVASRPPATQTRGAWTPPAPSRRKFCPLGLHDRSQTMGECRAEA